MSGRGRSGRKAERGAARCTPTRVFTVSTDAMDEHTSDEWIALAPLTRLTERTIELLSRYRAA